MKYIEIKNALLSINQIREQIEQIAKTKHEINESMLILPGWNLNGA